MTRPHRQFDLDDVRRIYSVWGRHPTWYFAQDLFSFMGRHREIRSAAVEELGLQSGDEVLEVGCGNGRNLRYLRDAVGAVGQVVGIDVTPEMLAAARRLVGRAGWDNVELQVGDAATVELDEAAFDGALAVMSLSAMPRPEDALRRVYRALKPGAVLSVADGQNFPGRLSFLNPLLEDVVAPLGAWHPWRSVPDAMYRVFGNVSVREHNFGSFFVAHSVR